MTIPNSSLSTAVLGTFRGAGWTPRLVFSLLGMMLLVEAIALGYHTAATALPAISTEFQTRQGAWILTAYALAGAVTAPVFGKMADRWGKRRLLLTALAIATTGAFIAASAPTFSVLVLGRALEGVIMAAMFLTYSLMRDVYPPKIVPFATTVSVTGAGVLALALPTVIGLLIDNLGFRSVFVFEGLWVLIMGTIIALTTSESPVRGHTRIDLLGSCLIAGGLGGTLAGVSLGNSWGWSNPRTLLLILGGLSLLGVYAYYSLNRKDPVLDIRMFGRRGILLAVCVATVSYGCGPILATLLSLISLTPPEFGGGYGLGISATALALITTPQAVANFMGGMTAGLIVRRFGPVNIAVTGMSLMGLGMLWVSLRHDSVLDLAVGACIFGIGGGFAMGTLPNIVISATPALQQSRMSAGVQVVVSGIGSVTPVLAFVVMGTTAFDGPGGAVVYQNATITISLFACFVLAALGVALALTVLRPRPEDLDDAEPDPVRAELLKAELSKSSAANKPAAPDETGRTVDTDPTSDVGPSQTTTTSHT